MAKYLIAAPHSADPASCLKTIKIFLETGSHFLANADWGCPDGNHFAYLIVDVDDKNQAKAILPPGFRDDATITTVAKFTLDQVNGLIGKHPQLAAKGSQQK